MNTLTARGQLRNLTPKANFSIANIGNNSFFLLVDLKFQSKIQIPKQLPKKPILSAGVFSDTFSSTGV